MTCIWMQGIAWMRWTQGGGGAAAHVFKRSEMQVGLLINFNVLMLRDGIRRRVFGLRE